MSFYYLSIFSLMLLIVIYAIGTALLVWVAHKLRGSKGKWLVFAPLALLVYIGPIAEELWIAWNFGQLCRKDAGIFVYKTVEVEGFYDATRPAHAGAPTVPAQKSMDASGYRFHERPLRDRKGGPNKVVRFEKIDGIWMPTVLDKPTARYHYRWPHANTPVGYKVAKTERLVADSQNGDVLGRYVDYSRTAPWFYIGLDRPLMFCKEAERDAHKLGTTFGPRMVLQPAL